MRKLILFLALALAVIFYPYIADALAVLALVAFGGSIGLIIAERCMPERDLDWFEYLLFHPRDLLATILRLKSRPVRPPHDLDKVTRKE